MKIKPLYSRRRWNVGDLVRMIGMPENLKDDAEFKTLTLFKLCQGEEFRISDFDRYNHVGIDFYHKRKPQFRKFKTERLYVEPHFLRRVRRAKRERK